MHPGPPAYDQPGSDLAEHTGIVQMSNWGETYVQNYTWVLLGQGSTVSAKVRK